MSVSQLSYRMLHVLNFSLNSRFKLNSFSKIVSYVSLGTYSFMSEAAVISSCYCWNQLCRTLCNLIVCSVQASLSFTISSGVCSNSCPLNWWCHPVISFSVTPFSSCPQSSLDSGELALRIMWPKCWSFNFSIIPSTKYLGLTSFRIDWFDLFPVQEALQSSSVPQFESISSSAFGFFYGSGLTSVHDYWKTVALTIRALVGKVMFLLFNMLSRFVSFPS